MQWVPHSAIARPTGVLNALCFWEESVIVLLKGGSARDQVALRCLFYVSS